MLLIPRLTDQSSQVYLMFSSGVLDRTPSTRNIARFTLQPRLPWGDAQRGPLNGNKTKSDLYSRGQDFSVSPGPSIFVDVPMADHVECTIQLLLAMLPDPRVAGSNPALGRMLKMHGCALPVSLFTVIIESKRFFRVYEGLSVHDKFIPSLTRSSDNYIIVK